MSITRACGYLLGSAIALAACGRPASGGDDPPPAPNRLDNPEVVRFHMRRHFDDLREVERMLVAGKLADAKARAFLLTKPASDPGLAPWSTHSSDLVEAARSLVDATSLAQACRREAMVALACAGCHVRSQRPPIFTHSPRLPVDDATPAIRMARHQWAADRLWEGMISGSKQPWRAGLDVLAATPLPFSPRTSAPKLADQLQALARTAIGSLDDGSETLDGRAKAYGDMLATCAACHAITKR